MQQVQLRFQQRSDEARGEVAVAPLKGGRVVQDQGYELIRISSAAFVARSSQAAGNVFVGDWETGDRSQWDRLHYKTGGVASDQFAIVQDPARQGAFAARFTVRPGDVFNSGGERSEVVKSHGKARVTITGTSGRRSFRPLESTELLRHFPAVPLRPPLFAANCI